MTLGARKKSVVVDDGQEQKKTRKFSLPRLRAFVQSYFLQLSISRTHRSFVTDERCGRA